MFAPKVNLTSQVSAKIHIQSQEFTVLITLSRDIDRHREYASIRETIFDC